VREGSGHFTEVYDCLQPYERKELVRLLLHRVEVSDHRITIEIRGRASLPAAASEDASRFQRPSWLPDEDSNLEPTG
jgi:hypothetical protein